MHNYRWQRESGGPGQVSTLYKGDKCMGVLQAITNYWEDRPYWKYYGIDGRPYRPLGWADELTMEEAQNMALSIAMLGVDMRAPT